MTMLLETLLVGVGGACGALARGALSSFTKRIVSSAWPWATFAINIIACLAMGLLMRANLGRPLYLMVTSGFLGGFSTLSTLNYEAVSLVEVKHRRRLAVGYLAATYVVCLGAAAVGFLVAGFLMG